MRDDRPVAFAVSCLSEGLLLVDGERVERLDSVPSAGLRPRAARLRARRARPVRDGCGRRGHRRRAAGFAWPGLRDAHELAWDGELVAGVATLANAVRWFDRRGRVVRSWRAPGSGDCWHLSGIAVDRDRQAVSAFGRFRRHRDWAEVKRDGAGFVLELPSGRVLLGGLDSPHSPRFVDGALAVCDSGRGELVVGGRRVRIGGWTRGLAVTRSLFVVGVSARRGEVGRAHLALVRRSDLALVRRIALPVREVFDIVELAPDRARRLALPAPDTVPTAPLRPADLRASIAAPWALRVRAGALHDVRCIVTNLGSEVLRGDPPHPVEIVARWVPAGRALWSPLPGALRPGEQVDLPVRVLAPGQAGAYTLELRAVQAGVAWLDGRASVEVTVA